MATSSLIRLSPDSLGIIQAPVNLDSSLEAANHFLQKNHDEHHIFWREVAGHNHIAHSVLSVLALGGDPSDLQRAFEDGAEIQRSIPPVDQQVVQHLSDPDQFRVLIGQLDQYPNFLAFFAQEIEKKGWVAVVQERVFSKSPNAETVFANLLEGLYHPLIHLGLGIEFAQPSIIAEALAQAASHDSMGIEPFLFRTEQEETATQAKASVPIVQLLHALHSNGAVRAAPHGFEDGPARVREGVLGRVGRDVVGIAAQFRVGPKDLQRALAETTNASAFAAGAAQRPGKERKIDFFHMHGVTASIFLTVLLRQSWISDEDKARLVKWKARVDLVWYAASAAVELRLQDIVDYKPSLSAGMDWNALFRAVLKVHDDGHLSKFVRALKNGQELSKPFEEGEGADAFPIKGEAWLKIAQIAYDSTAGRPIEEKWIWGVGFDENWAHVPSLK